MPKYLLVNTVLPDGTGDFTHFEDIVNALLANPVFADVEFFALVNFVRGGSLANSRRILQKLQQLKIPYLYEDKGSHHKLDFVLCQKWQKILSEVDQVIIISFGGIPFGYSKYLKPDIPLKAIYEHEALGSGYEISRPLGLSEGCYGIKISDTPKNEPWDMIEKEDPEFAKQLMEHTNTSDFAEFSEQHSVMPAYFNNDKDFVAFLHFLGIHINFFNKNSVVYHSGKNFNERFNDFTESGRNAFVTLFKTSSVGNIKIITPNNSKPQTIEINPQEIKTIYIFTGFYVSDHTFAALYQLSLFAGVSGDNTFERCVSMKILPFYRSTNEEIKRPTVAALKEISQLEELAISAEAKASFNVYFDRYAFEEHLLASFTCFDPFVDPISQWRFSLLNIPAMLEAWPIFTAYLRQHYNFYDKLEGIVLEGLPPEARPDFKIEKKELKSLPIFFQPQLQDDAINEELSPRHSG